MPGCSAAQRHDQTKARSDVQMCKIRLVCPCTGKKGVCFLATAGTFCPIMPCEKRMHCGKQREPSRMIYCP
eukprot:6206493-Pleurochrysis_carterae.AAC.1